MTVTNRFVNIPCEQIRVETVGVPQLRYIYRFSDSFILVSEPP